MSTASDFLRDHPELLDADRTSIAALRWNARISTLLAAYFRFSLHGTEHLPDEPCLLVANHSIGSPFVLPLLARGWRRAFGDRPVRGLMHRLAWQKRTWPLGPLLQRLGGLFAHPDVGRRALAGGKSLLVFPGGEFDAMRPFTDRYRVDFAGRTGFVRLAKAAGVPIVPLAICGSHAAYVSLPAAQPVARWLGSRRSLSLDRLPVTAGAVALAATLALPPLWPLAPVAFLQAVIPWPTRIEARFLPPYRIDASASDAAAAEHVRGALESALVEMGARRRTFLG